MHDARQRPLLGALIVSTLLCFASLGFAEPTKKAWTLMVYMAADNNLEATTMDNLEELMQIGSSPDANVVVLADRSKKGDSDEEAAAKAEKADDDDNDDAGSDETVGTTIGFTNRDVGNLRGWDGAKLIFVEKDHLKELANWEDANTGDPATLKKFLETSIKDFPAERYALIISDHGMGWHGICIDETADNDYLKLGELQSVFQEVTAKTGKFELFGFDACLMGNLEVLLTLAPYAKVLVASEELVPGAGWNYVPVLRTLAKNPKSSGLEIGGIVAESFQDYFSKADRRWGEGITLSVVDSEKLPSVEAAVNKLAETLEGQLQKDASGSWLKIARARARSAEFGRSIDGKSGSQLFDLSHFATLAHKNVPEAFAAADVQKAMKEAVVHNIRGKGRPNSNGLSIFFPANHDVLENGEPEDRYAALPVASRGKWYSMVRRFTDVGGDQKLEPLLKEVKASGSIVSADREVTLSSQVVGKEIDHASLAIGKKALTGIQIVGQIQVDPDENGLLKEDIDNEWYALGDKRTKFHCPIIRWRTVKAEADDEEEEDDKDEKKEEGDDEEDVAEVPIQLRRAGHDGWVNATIGFYLDEEEDEEPAELAYAFTMDHNGVRAVQLAKGDSIRPLATIIQPNGKVKQVPLEDKVIKIEKLQSLTMSYLPLEPGEYVAGYIAANLAGDIETELVDVKIE